MKDAAIERLMMSHSISWGLAAECVDESGNVDHSKLQAILMGVQWGKSPGAAVAGDPRIIRSLSNAYHDALARGDGVACVALKNNIHRLGGIVMPRKA